MTTPNQKTQGNCAVDPVPVELQPSNNEQELLEWRDLQNAQIESMMHVWDNPEDECWNDVPLDEPNKPLP